MKRSKQLLALAVVGISLATAACGGSTAASPTSSSSSGSGSASASAGSGGSAAAGTVNIGLVEPFSGVQASLAKSEGIGAQVAMDEINAAGGISNKWKINLVREDDQLSTTQSASVIRDLSSKGVQIAMGGQTSDTCQSLAQASNRLNILFIGAHCTSSKLVNPPITPNFWMTAAQDTDLTKAEGDFLAERFPAVKSWDVFAYDQTVTRGFWTQTQAQMAKKLGKPVTEGQSFYVPAATTSYRNQLASQVSGLTGDKTSRALFLGVYGSGTTSYIQQARPLGLLDDYAAIAQVGALWPTAVSLKGTMPSIYDVYEYFYSCQSNAVNDKFVKDYEAAAGQKPDTGAYQGYINVKLLAAAIAKAGAIDQKSVAAALPGLSIDTPTGLKLTMNGTTHHADQPITVADIYGDPKSPEGVGVRDCKTVLASAV